MSTEEKELLKDFRLMNRENRANFLSIACAIRSAQRNSEKLSHPLPAEPEAPASPRTA